MINSCTPLEERYERGDRTKLTELRLHGMAGAAKDLLAQKTPVSVPEALRQLIRSERAERETRSILNRMKTAKAPRHKDFASFEYAATPVEQATIQELTTGQFTRKAQNLILVGGAISLQRQAQD